MSDEKGYNGYTNYETWACALWKSNMNNIEDTIFDNAIAVNCNVALNRIKEVMKELQTNNLQDCKDDVRIKRLMWFLNSFMYGQMATINMAIIWNELYKEYKKEI